MVKRSRRLLLLGTCAVLFLVCGILIGGPPGQKEQEKERKVEEKDVPKAALEALKKAAGGATITKFEENIEHGSTFYEGAYKGPHGTVEALVTTDGDLVEIEEAIPADAVPKAVLAVAQKAAGKDAELRFEKETVILYEAKFKKGDRFHELVLTPDGREKEHEEKEIKKESKKEGEHEEDD
jgi:hypothetical protein